MNDARAMLRHTVATLAYRGGKVLRGASEQFATFRPFESSRTPAEILAHIGDLLDWAFHIAQSRQVWKSSSPLPWNQEVDRFFAGLKRLDDYLGSDEPLGAPVEKLFQAPIADALTHVGQIGMLRRMAGEPIRGENYFQATIETGRVGVDQASPGFEFD
jgi:hypothetical protein